MTKSTHTAPTNGTNAQRVSEALGYFESDVRFDPTSLNARLNLAIYHRDHGDRALFRRHAARAFHMYPNMPTAKVRPACALMVLVCSVSDGSCRQSCSVRSSTRRACSRGGRDHDE